MDWSECDLIGSVPGKASGVPVFKGTRLPADTVVNNVDAYMWEGLSLEDAIAETLESFPGVPGGVEGVHAVLAYRDALIPAEAAG